MYWVSVLSQVWHLYLCGLIYNLRHRYYYPQLYDLKKWRHKSSNKSLSFIHLPSICLLSLTSSHPPYSLFEHRIKPESFRQDVTVLGVHSQLEEGKQELSSFSGKE